MSNSNLPVIDAPEIVELIALIKKIYGFDFSLYAKASLKRRILRFMQLRRLNYYDIKHELINDKNFFQDFLEEITVNVTEMFRDPAFYSALRTEVLPYLGSFNNINIWSAGCATGEEAYSIAILLHESSLNHKSIIHGTDVNSSVIKTAKKGIYQLDKIKSYAQNYQLAGLSGSITQYFTMMYDASIIQAQLKENTVFSVHNLITDRVFNQFHLICCRNVFIYFELDLQEKVLDLFYNSLAMFGFLCLGSREMLRSDRLKGKFKVIDDKQNIYQKIV